MTDQPTSQLAVIEPAQAQIEAAPADRQQQFTLQEMMQMSNAFAQSGMFGIRNVAQALSMLLIAQAEGIHPAKAMMEYHVIENKPSLKADAMLARHQRGGGKVKWIARTDTCVKALFTGPLGEVEITWDQARATKAGLWGKANFQKHPAQMLAARCISEGVRAVNPAAIQGFYAPEELGYSEMDHEPQPAPAQPTQVAKPTADATAQNGGNGNALAAAGSGAAQAQSPTQPASPAAPTAADADAVPPPEQPKPQVALPGLQVGVEFTARLSQGTYCERENHAPYYRWMALDTLTGQRAWVYCWHLDSPKTATGSETPQGYAGDVKLLLSKQYTQQTNDSGQEVRVEYFKVERISKVEVAGDGRS